MDIRITPLTAADIAEVATVPHRYRVSGETARLAGAIIAIGGAAHLPDGSLLAFAHLTGEARRRKVWLHRQAKRMLARLAARRRRIIATASPDVAAAERWLKRLGFAPMPVAGGTLWVLDRDAARCERQPCRMHPPSPGRGGSAC